MRAYVRTFACVCVCVCVCVWVGAFAQEQAIGKVNAGVVKKNMASVMSAPGAMLGRLQRAAVVGHLHKLTPDLAQLIEDELCRANCRLGDKPPKVLRMAEQTIFALGYYQQTARLQTIKAQLDKKHRHRSDQGEWMRSKLEVKVANAMARAGIVYIYEPSKLLLDAGLKYPDFVIRGASEADNVYIEVAGFPGEEYERRHQLKIEAYQREGISTEGGPNGRLVVLDYRGEGVDFDEMSVLSALSFLVKPNNQTPQTLSEEDSSDA